MPRIDIPPPGRAMAFPEWSEALVREVRHYIPEAKAARKGPRLVILRYGMAEAHLTEGSSFSVAFRPGDGSLVTLPGIWDDRRDDFTVGNIARTIAGFFDGRWTVPESL